jgi:transposase
MVGMRPAARIELSAEERETLERWARNGKTEQRIARRARIVLAAADGEQTVRIAERLGERASTVSRWRQRFSQRRLGGLDDSPRSGPPPRYDVGTEARVLTMLDEPPPVGYSQWNGRLVSLALGDVSVDQVRRVLRSKKIQLQRKRSWCISTDPQFGEKAADVVGLYLNPPENALVLSVDEKPHIQALERAQGYLRLPNGTALRGVSHEYKRHGTSTLFAALDVMTGKVFARHTNRRRRREFLAFMNELVALHPDREMHVVLDNLSTHKPKHDRWLARHPQVHLHFTPTHASWLNQIECWFSILSRAALKGASFTSPRELREAIDRFIEAHNDTAEPFEWTKVDVHPVSPKRYIANLRA